MLKGRNTRLTTERINLLDKLSFVWEAQRGGPRRQQRATVSVPEQAHPVQVRSKVRKGDYAQMMANTAQMMLPGAYPMMPFPMPPGMMMPGMVMPEQTDEQKKKSKDGGSGGDESETNAPENEETKKDGANASPGTHPYFNPHMMMNPQQMMAAMGWPMMPAGTPPAGPMAFGFFPMGAPYMMPGWPQAKTDPLTSPTAEADGSDDKKRKSSGFEEASEGDKRAKTDADETPTTEEKIEAPEETVAAMGESEI